MTYKNIVAFVTGAGRGLGKATALYLAMNNAKVVIADIDAIMVQKMVQEIGNDNAIAAVLDVCNESQVQTSLNQAVEKWGKLNLVVNCAGIAPPMKTISKRGAHDLNHFIKTMNINTVGTFNVARLAVEKMILNEPDEDGCRGLIINTASIAAMDGQIGQVAYASSKGAIVSMTLPMARDLADYGIRVNAIAPGLFLTPLMESLPLKVQQDLAKTVPFPRRLGKPIEFAKLVTSIMDNPMINGEVIRLDGAIRLPP